MLARAKARNSDEPMPAGGIEHARAAQGQCTDTPRRTWYLYVQSPHNHEHNMLSCETERAVPSPSTSNACTSSSTGLELDRLTDLVWLRFGRTEDALHADRRRLPADRVSCRHCVGGRCNGEPMRRRTDSFHHGRVHASRRSADLRGWQEDVNQYTRTSRPTRRLEPRYAVRRPAAACRY